MGTEIGPFSTAAEMLAALDAGNLSSVELVDMHLEWIDEHDGELNAIAVRTTDRARESAVAADAARASGQRNPLLGLPMTLKESTQVAGLPQSAGIPPLADHRPQHDGPIAARVPRVRVCSARPMFPSRSPTGKPTARCMGTRATLGTSTVRPAVAREAVPRPWLRG